MTFCNNRNIAKQNKHIEVTLKKIFKRHFLKKGRTEPRDQKKQPNQFFLLSKQL